MHVIMNLCEPSLDFGRAMNKTITLFSSFPLGENASKLRLVEVCQAR